MRNFLIKKPVKFKYKQDCHPKKGFVNWWEYMGYYKSKSAKRQQFKKETLLEYNTDTSAGLPIKEDDIVRYSFEKRRVQDKELVYNIWN